MCSKQEGYRAELHSSSRAVGEWGLNIGDWWYRNGHKHWFRAPSGHFVCSHIQSQ